MLELTRHPTVAAIAVTLVLGAGAAPALGAGIQDHAAIRVAAEQFALSQAAALAPRDATVAAHPAVLDPRLALRACPVPLETFSPPGFRPAARISVGVRCPSADGWSLFVPVRIEVVTDVVVLAAPARRGDVLTTAQLALERRDVAQLLEGYVTRLEDAEDMVLRRSMALGTVLTSGSLERPTLIRRGQRVEIISRSGTFSVRAEAEALSDGGAGDRVRARNLRSRQVVEGVVDDQGRLQVGESA